MTGYNRTKEPQKPIAYHLSPTTYWWLDTIESRSLKNQLPTTYRLIPIAWHVEKNCRNKPHMPATNSFHLPHHCVIKDTSSTTNLRVVLSASAMSANGVSLNDRLTAGPQFQKDLFWILIRFRFHQVALSADIARRYRQVQLDDEENDFHRVFWKKIQMTQTWRHPEWQERTYGIESSSYNSIRPLKAFADSFTNSNLRLVINKTNMWAIC